MAVYFVVQGRVEDRAKLAEYREKVGPTLTPDLTVLAIDETPQIIEGEAVIEGEVVQPRTVILEFPSEESFRVWYDSDEYQALVGLRKEAESGYALLVEGVAAGG
ncbi:MAG: DUF1330 domain-containing protein [Actinomycetia bacterium]|nr:DUF1330 domain-containing protein [Actinomycetes bacterium]